MVAAIFS